MSNDRSPAPPTGSVPLASAIGSLRDELTNAWWDSRDQSLRFKVAPVELTLQIAVTSDKNAKFGLRWWLLELGGEAARSSAVTQTVKLTLEPLMLDERGQPHEFLIDAPEEQRAPAPTVSPVHSGSEVQLDAPG